MSNNPHNFYNILSAFNKVVNAEEATTSKSQAQLIRESVDKNKHAPKSEQEKKVAADLKKERRSFSEASDDPFAADFREPRASQTPSRRIHRAGPGGYGNQYDNDEVVSQMFDPDAPRGRGRPKGLPALKRAQRAAELAAKGMDPNAPRGRGRPSADSEDSKLDTAWMQDYLTGGVPSKLPGTPGMKHIMHDVDESINEDQPGKKIDPKRPWANLPNATHIDRIVTLYHQHISNWYSACDKLDYLIGYKIQYQAWNKAEAKCKELDRLDIWSDSKVPSLAAILALIAYDDSAKYLNMTSEELLPIARRGVAPAVLLLPAVIAFEEIAKPKTQFEEIAKPKSQRPQVTAAIASKLKAIAKNAGAVSQAEKEELIKLINQL